MHPLLRDLLEHIIPPLKSVPYLADILTMVILLVIFIGFVSVSALVLIWLERKISARMQMRTGPMLAAPWGSSNRNMWAGGVFQTTADAV
ncbi:MAG: NADH-quinone oxidoreductase subunit H, partial [Candidatus Xenobia bacterium]